MWDAVCRARRPVVGHNMLLDLAFVFHAFVCPLPGAAPPSCVRQPVPEATRAESFSEFKQAVHSLLPTVFDTKQVGQHSSGTPSSSFAAMFVAEVSAQSVGC